MTLRLVVSCDGTFDEGRMPCRANLPLKLRDPHTEAETAGWLLEPARDLCPAHAAKETTAR